MTPEERLAAMNVHRLPRADLTDAPAKGNGKEQKPPRFPLVKVDDVSATTTSLYLVKNLIPRSGLVVVWGAPKCGKSFWTFDLLMHAALGSPYRGLRAKAGSIIYCALEGAEGFKRRIAARQKHTQSKGAQFHLMFTPIDMIRDYKALIASIRAQLAQGVRPAAVAIDTLNRSFVGSENKPEDMAAYVRAADEIRIAFDCVVIIVHHCGHNGDRPRGHSSLLGAADVLIAVKRDEADNIVAMVERAKDGPTGLVIISRLVIVDLGEDEDGDAITSCIVEPVGEPGATKAGAKPKSLTKTAKNALRALHMAIGELGEVQTSSHIPADVRAVTVEQWRSFAYKIGISTSDKPHSKGVAFNRGSEALLDANKIGIWEPYVWPAFQVET
jgi:AAA domain